jgi:pimeloyl-ACP methyl ester carboxylesterase
MQVLVDYMHAGLYGRSNHAVTAEIVGCLQRPEVLLIDGADHLPNAEAETEFNDALRAFLWAHAPGSSA